MGKKKNSGGNRHKKQGRKHVNTSNHKAKLRTVHLDGEMYAKVVKINGGGTADVLCNDGVLRLLIIRKKFKGRNKRDNQIKLHSIVLAGLRSWEVVGPKKKPKADLLYIYTASQLFELYKVATINDCILPEELRSALNESDAYHMTDAEPSSPPPLEKLLEPTGAPATLPAEELDWDDI